MSLAVLLVALQGSWAAPTASADQESVVGQIGGRTGPVAAFGNYAVYGEAARMLVADVGSTDDPVVVGRSVVLPDEISDIVVSGMRAYVVWRWGLCVFDLRDPRRPTQVFAYRTDYVAQNVAVVGNHVYLAGRGVWVLDEDRPEAPLLGRLAYPPSLSRSIAADESTIYLLTDEGVSVFDISTQALLLEVSTIEVDGADVALDGSRLFVADGNGLSVFDVSDPQHPRVLGALPLAGGAWCVAAEAGRAYVVAGALRLVVADVSDPSQPRQLHAVEWVGLPRGLAVGQNVAAVTFGDFGGEPAGLRVVDLTDMSLPRPSGAIHGVGPVVSADVGDGFVYVVTSERHPLSGGFRVIDTAIAGATEAIGWLDWGQGSAAGEPLDVAVLGRWAYTAVGEGPPDRAPTAIALRVVDVRNPRRPQQVARLPVVSEFGPTEIVLESDRLILAVGPTKVFVIDLARRERPTVLAELAVPRHIDIAVSSGSIFMVTDEAELRMMRFGESGSPEAVGTLGKPSSVTAVAGALYVGTDEGIEVFSLAESRPRFATIVKTPSVPSEMVVWSRYLYVLDGMRKTLFVFDVMRPTDPVAIGSLGLQDYVVTHVEVGQWRVYALTNQGTLLVLLAPATWESRAYLPLCRSWR
jgi:hypothetical protein